MIIQTPNRGNIENKTNCVTHIPQDIKLTLVNGVLTLKAGSKVYIPDGFEDDGVTKKFEEYVLENDIVNTDFSVSTTIPDLWFYPKGHNSLSGWSINACFSGSDPSSVSSSITWAVYYDVSINKILYRAGDTTWHDGKYSIPICLAYNTGTPEDDKILTVFNGASYIGKHVFVLPGVKGLCPDGFNPDGTTKNKEVVIDSVHISYFNPNWGTSLSGHKFYFFILYGSYNECQPDVRVVYSGKQLPSSTFTGAFFNEIKNYWEWYANGSLSGKNFFLFVCSFYGTITATDASISGFVPAKVFEEKPQEDLLQDYSLGEVYTGKRWIDGKKIYRKTFVGENISKLTGTAATVSWSISNLNLDVLVNVVGSSLRQYDGTYYYAYPLWSSFANNDTFSVQTAYATAIDYSSQNLNLFISGSLALELPKVYVTIYYTKTTD